VTSRTRDVTASTALIADMGFRGLVEHAKYFYGLGVIRPD